VLDWRIEVVSPLLFQLLDAGFRLDSFPVIARILDESQEAVLSLIADRHVF
jgi:hypothetical protein